MEYVTFIHQGADSYRTLIAEKWAEMEKEAGKKISSHELAYRLGISPTTVKSFLKRPSRGTQLFTMLVFLQALKIQPNEFAALFGLLYTD